MAQDIQETKSEAKVAWHRPSFRVLEARDAEIGFGVGADLVIPGTSS
jgi:hypothetical protein